jgi:hypothetical protein
MEPKKSGNIAPHYLSPTGIAFRRGLSQSASAVTFLPQALDQVSAKASAISAAQPIWTTFAQERIGTRAFGEDRILNPP